MHLAMGRHELPAAAEHWSAVTLQMFIAVFLVHERAWQRIVVGQQRKPPAFRHFSPAPEPRPEASSP